MSTSKSPPNGRTPWQYSQGLHEVGPNSWAYLQPDGGWGWSNAGLITDSDQSLLVDTLYGKSLTLRMLAAMRDATGAAAQLDTVVNTHSNGDHCYGNDLVGDSHIVATAAAAEELRLMPPSKMAALMRLARVLSKLPWPLSAIPSGRGTPNLKELGHFVQQCFGPFDFEGIETRLPDETFSGELSLKVGDREVQLIEVGPAHTQGDLLVWVPDARVVYTGDILFSSGHPIAWAGPLSRWTAACERIEALNPEVVVPGHGPVVDLEPVRRVKRYLSTLETEGRLRFDAGMTPLQASQDMNVQGYEDWGESERLVANLDTLWREFRGQTKPTAPLHLFALMTALARGEL